MKSYLFHFTFGPIQSFIAQSRKTRDLYAASRILSRLAKAAAEAVKNQGGKLIIPQDLDSDSLPNYLLAEFEQVPDGASIQNTVRQTFAAIAEQAHKQTRVAKPAGFDSQIAEHLEAH